VPFSEDPAANLRSMVLPSFALAVWLAGPLARFVRSSLIEVLQTPFVTTARAKGLPERRVLRGHALKNALIPTVTFAGLQVGGLIGGAIVTEVVFSLPGTGTLALSSILNRDFPVVQGVVLVVACAYVLINIGVDLVYVVLDPRIALVES
jgi:ABC-type dipeptide/oligopeptide/nickel transport system permease component